jgi:hypothetical protein
VSDKCLTYADVCWRMLTHAEGLTVVSSAMSQAAGVRDFRQRAEESSSKARSTRGGGEHAAAMSAGRSVYEALSY